MSEIKTEGTKNEFERCVVCGTQTNVPREMHIDFRDCYIEGAGQLCRDCYTKLYH